MHLLAEAMNGLGAVLLPVAVGLLFEELTFGGLVRLMLAPLPGTGRRGTTSDRSRSQGYEHGVPIDRSSSMGSEHGERNRNQGEGR
ncbi:MAG: hypothetical protein ABSB60_09045 [Terracidiphilus sp.]|jgi:hypothetical protein